ncbi:hypothetical protein TWF730_008884 [Orbilia blumenaviensis]|uniref:DNA 3'-5' helicase n=1 Tax=Orbilia blumenaviensis TaxID=1796055 RepID=A0AAV9V4W9_9PEZI
MEQPLSAVVIEDVTAQFEPIDRFRYAIRTMKTVSGGVRSSIKVAICTECQYLVLWESLVNHLVSNHGKDRGDVKRVVGSVVADLKDHLSPEMDIVAFQGKIQKRYIARIPDLKVSTGYQCDYCQLVYSTKDSVITHRSRCSHDTRPVGQRSHRKLVDDNTVDCQLLFGGRRKTYFRVHEVGTVGAVAGAVAGSAPGADAGADAEGRQEAEFLLDMIKTRSNLTDTPSELQTPVPWFERTGWLDFCGGSNETVAKVCRLNKLGRDSLTTTIHTATKALLSSSLEYIPKTGVGFLCKISSPNEADDSRPFSAKLVATTLDDYFTIMTRMVVYLCNLLDPENEELNAASGVVFPDEIENNLEYIISFAGSGTVSGADGFSPGELEYLGLLILDVIIGLMRAPVPVTTESRFEHPVINYLATLGWDEKRGAWRKAELSTRFFAAMTYSTRLCVLRYCWVKALNTDTDPNDALRSELNAILDIIKERKGYPMSEWLSQHAYSAAITQHSAGPAKLHWKNDGTGIWYNGELFCIIKYRSFIKTVPDFMKKQLRELLFLKDDEEIPTIDISKLFDDPSDTSRGYYFASDPKTLQSQGQPTYLLNKVTSEPRLRNMFFPRGVPVLSQLATKNYMDLDTTMRRWLAVAVWLMSGEPPRGTELSVLRKFNTASNLRNFFVVDGDVLILSVYIKTQSMTGFSKGIARYLPPDVAQLFLVYMLLVDPFCDYLRSKDGTYALSSYLFANHKGIPWESNVLSDFLATYAQAAIGFPLKHSNYRQIMAGITRAYVDPMSKLIERKVEQEENVLAEQFGHGRRTNISVYGIGEGQRFADIDEITMDIYRRATCQFQFFIGAIPNLPDWVVEPSKIYFEIGVQPRFREPAYPETHQLPPAVQPGALLPVDPRFRAPVQGDAFPLGLPGLPGLPGPSGFGGSPASSFAGTSAQGTGSSVVVSNYFAIKEPFPRELHAVLFEQYATKGPDGKLGRANWKLPEQGQAAEAIYKKSLSPLLVTLACAAGKTTAALLAIKAGTGISIIVEPYISTCEDVVARAKAMGIYVTYWASEYRGRDEEGEPTYRMIKPRHISKKVPGIMIATPEAATSPAFLDAAFDLHRDRRLDRIIIDEIHQPILDEGFRDVARLSLLTNMGLQLVCMSATTPPLMLAPICNFFHLGSFHEIRSTTSILNMQYEVKPVTEDVVIESIAYIKELYSHLMAMTSVPQKNKILVFCRSISQAETLCDSLHGASIGAGAAATPATASAKAGAKAGARAGARAGAKSGAKSGVRSGAFSGFRAAGATATAGAGATAATTTATAAAAGPSIPTKITAFLYIGTMEIEERSETMAAWDRKGGIMCATTCFGPGVDAKHVVAVIHVGCPYTIVDLVQQSSRAGRDGSPAVNVVICRKPSPHAEDNYNNKQLWRRESQKALNLYLTTTTCRRWVLSSFMDGNQNAIDCVLGNGALCDNCGTLRDPKSVAAAVAVVSRPRSILPDTLPRTSRNAARHTQAAAIIEFIQIAMADCAYCRFTLESSRGHSLADCPMYTPPKEPTTWVDAVCTKCGLPKRVCIVISSQDTGCQCYEVCEAIYSAVHTDPDIRFRVFGELGLRGLRLHEWPLYTRWLAEIEFSEGKAYSNAWKIWQTLEELNYLQV